MIRRIAPVFFTTDIPATLAYYTASWGSSAWVRGRIRPSTRSWRATGRRSTSAALNLPTPNPDKYREELLDAYLFVEDADALYAEYGAQGVEFTRDLGNMPWHSREFVLKDCDGRLLAFGASVGAR